MASPGRRAPRAASTSSPTSRPCAPRTPRSRVACATPHGRRSRCSAPTRGCAPSSIPPATTSSHATTPTGRPDERHERHRRHRRNHRHDDRAHRAAPPRGAAGAAVRDLVRARDRARGAPRARRHRRGRRLGRVRRRSGPVLLGRVRRRRGIRDRALSRSRAARRHGRHAVPHRAAPDAAGTARPRDRVRAGHPCRSRHPWHRPSRSSRAIAWRRPRSRLAVLDAELRAQGVARASTSARCANAVDCGVSVGITPTHRRAARRGRRLRRRGLPPDQAQDQARLGPRAGRRGPRAVRRACCCRSTPTRRTRSPTPAASPSSTRSTCC